MEKNTNNTKTDTTGKVTVTEADGSTWVTVTDEDGTTWTWKDGEAV